MGKLKDFYKWLWSGDYHEESQGPGYLLKAFLRIVCIVFMGFNRHQLELRASALTYTVILSLVPVLAMGTAIVKGLGADNYMKQAAYRMLEEMNELSEKAPSITTSQPPAQGKNNPKVDHRISSKSVEHLKLAIDKIFDYVDKTNFATLGWLGIAASLFTVISLMTHIEEAMNTIWETRRSRELGQKVIDYIALIVLMPLSINIAFWAITANQNKAILEKMTSLLKISWILPLIFKFVPFLLLIGTFTILYRFMPNTRVRWWPATLGGIIGGAGWIVAQTLYIKLQIGVARYNAIYGSFATLPLFIFWVYIGWIIFLMGAETSYALQHYRRLCPTREPLTPLRQLALALDIINLAYKYFDQGRPMSLEDASDELGHPLREIDMVAEKLIDAGLLVRTESMYALLPGISKNHLRRSDIFRALCGNISEERTIGEKIASSFYKEALEKLDSLRDWDKD